MVSKYGEDEWGWSPCKVPRYGLDNVWGSILRVRDESHACGVMFHKGVGFKVGEGNKVHFWVDDWLGKEPLMRVYTRLFRLASNKLSSVKDCYMGEGGFVSWIVSFRRVRQSEESMF